MHKELIVELPPFMVNDDGELYGKLSYPGSGRAKPRPEPCVKCGNPMTRFDHHPERCRQCLAVEHLQEFTRQQQEKADEK